MSPLKLLALSGVVAIVAGCAQQEEAPVISPQPTYDKFGGGECTDGYIYVPGTAPEVDLCIPEDECDPVYDSTGQIIDCPPSPREPRRPRDNDNDREPQRTPTRSVTGAPATSAP